MCIGYMISRCPRRFLRNSIRKLLRYGRTGSSESLAQLRWQPLERFRRLHWSEKFGWREWWLLRRDVKRLLKGMVEAQVLVGCDIAIAEMEMRPAPGIGDAALVADVPPLAAASFFARRKTSK